MKEKFKCGTQLNGKSPLVVRVLPQKEYAVSYWSGGKTSQVMIWPLESEFKKHEFLWRISLATMEAADSPFTKFDGFHRILHLLDGESQLSFADGRNYILHPGDEVSFYGTDDIKSSGKAGDLNLIMADGVWGEMRSLRSDIPNWNWFHSIPLGGRNGRWCCILYLLSGKIEIENAIAGKGDCVVIYPESLQDGMLNQYAEKTFKTGNDGLQLIECMVYWREETNERDTAE